jgi:methionine biosynthesis protein MetW
MNTPLRADLQMVADWVPAKARVLDLGCGDGALLAWLQQHKAVRGYGVEIDVDKVVRCVDAGVSAIQGDLETGLSDFADNSFDLVILSQTIQAVRESEAILLEMLRVGREAIVTFPNFGFWQNRWQIMKGRMPVSETIPYQWYDTPNIHWCMLGDFETLCAKNRIQVKQRVVMDQGRRVNFLPNLLGSLAFYRVGPE